MSHDLLNDLAKLIMQVIISLGLLGVGIYILLTVDWSSRPELAAAAAGWIGLVAGYWLK